MLIEVARIRIRFVSRTKYFSLERNDISMDDVALEAVSNLLSNNDADYLESLRKTFVSWDPKIVTEEEGDFFVNKIIDRSIYQCIVKKYSEIDPLFSKILKEIKRIHQSNHQFKLIQRMGVDYLSTLNFEDIDELKIIPQDELIVLTISSMPDNNYIRGWIEEVFNSIQEYTNYNPILPINSLALKIKLEMGAVNKIEFNVMPDPEMLVLYKEGIVSSLRRVHSRIKNLKKKKNAYDDRTAAIFHEAITDIANDLLQGEAVKNYFDYLKYYDLELTMDIYRDNYRSQFEYLIKILKNEIANYYLEL
ncbi:MAG: hypothetical protein KJ666_08175 [Bacteroidetes bacterium]|nr:hypothetical protein [Bacteroidota bacterium]MBU2585349.1 hypothetical protein [Bacteroidota bacterium]